MDYVAILVAVLLVFWGIEHYVSPRRKADPKLEFDLWRSKFKR